MAAAEDIYRDALYHLYDLPVGYSTTTTNSKIVARQLIPGQLWTPDLNSPVTYGPARADVMVIGKMPGQEELLRQRNLVGKSGSLLLTMLRSLGVNDVNSWYVTNLLRYQPPEDKSTLSTSWIADCLPLLHQELRLVRPKYILCLGADATKALLGKGMTIEYMDGRVIPHKFPYHVQVEDEELIHTSKVMAVLHPAQVLRQPETENRLYTGLARFTHLLAGGEVDKTETDIDHKVIRNVTELKACLRQAERQITDGVVSVDAEWHGKHPQNPGAYLRTIQISWKEKTAACMVLRSAGGRQCFEPNIKSALTMLNKFFRNKRVVGHFLAADLEFLVPLGLDLRRQFRVPLKPRGKLAAWQRTRTEGGADTSLMLHAIDETARFGLEAVSVRYTSAPRYDIQLEEWKKAYCRKNKLKAEELEGYGDCPDEILIPYANYDADVTYRIFRRLEALLDCDGYGNCCREAFWRSMAVQPAVFEINNTGITLDMRRVSELTHKFIEARKRLSHQIVRKVRWPDFNIRSVQHVRELLFGEQLNGKKSRNGQPVRLRPPKGRSLYLRPIFDTSKRPVFWDEVVQMGEQHVRSPATNKQSLQLLLQDNPEHAELLTHVRDYRFIDQVLKSVLRPPDEPEDESGDDDESYSGGLAGALCGDGRLRTHIYTVKETGRWSSSRPPLQNISKVRDKDYARILGEENYKHKLRSMMRATRKGEPGAWCDEDCVLIESDFTGAELAMMAWMSGDADMIDHVRRNGLPEDHPDHYDIHSNVAKLAFRLTCPATKKGLKDAGKSYLRNIAKTVAFGIAYGRGAKAIAVAAREEGINITKEEAQQVIDAFLEMYPGLVSFFQECRDRVGMWSEKRAGFLCSAFGRFRRFPLTSERDVAGEQERQAMNFPIQGGIADAMAQAIVNLMQYRRRHKDPDMFRIVLQIHDAVLLEVPASRVPIVVRQAIPYCLERAVPIYPCALDGFPNGSGPYRLSSVTELYDHWGEPLSKKRCLRLGIPEEFGVDGNH